MNTMQQKVLAMAFLVLVVAGLYGRLTPVRVEGVDCADPPVELTTRCVVAEGDRIDTQLVVSVVVLAGAWAVVRVLRRREATVERRAVEQVEADALLFRPAAAPH